LSLTQLSPIVADASGGAALYPTFFLLWRRVEGLFE